MNLAIAQFGAEGPSRGRLSDSADVGYYRDMLTIIRDQVQHLIDRGMNLEQVVVERPTYGYDRRFGSGTGSWPTKMLKEAVYRSLSDDQ